MRIVIEVEVDNSSVQEIKLLAEFLARLAEFEEKLVRESARRAAALG